MTLHHPWTYLTHNNYTAGGLQRGIVKTHFQRTMQPWWSRGTVVCDNDTAAVLFARFCLLIAKSEPAWRPYQRGF